MPHVVSIIGSGPAGCSAAIELASRGIAVSVLERGRQYKDKACGDALISDAVRELTRLGLDERCLVDLGARPFDRVEFVRHERPRLRRVLMHPGGWTVPRTSLDQALRNRAAEAGAEILCEVTATSIDRTNGRFVTTARRRARTVSFESDAIVLATGASDTLPRHFGVSGDPVRAASIRGYVRTGDCAAPVFSFVDSRMVGYAWSFPMADGIANVGVCSGSSARIKRLRQIFDHYHDDHGFAPRDQVIGGAETLWSGKGRTWHQPTGLVSCGDAGGLVDPMTGEGITAALRSGALAGTAIADFLDAGDDVHLQRYSHVIKEHFSRRYRRPLLKRVFSRLSGTGLSR